MKQAAQHAGAGAGVSTTVAASAVGGDDGSVTTSAPGDWWWRSVVIGHRSEALNRSGLAMRKITHTHTK